jgi:hypothetical protein
VRGLSPHAAGFQLRAGGVAGIRLQHHVKLATSSKLDSVMHASVVWYGGFILTFLPTSVVSFFVREVWCGHVRKRVLPMVCFRLRLTIVDSVK